MIDFDNTYARLPEKFYARQRPTPVTRPELIAWNDSLASDLRLDLEGIGPEELAGVFAGNTLPDGSDPLAMAYAGHQFGQFVPQLGDGRAILLGEVLDQDGVRRDIQLKGAGRTPFSRAGDGRAWIGPVIREHLVSEAMHTLGIPTTRSLASVATGEAVYRETRLPGAVLTRVATSHLRIGTFEYFAARGDVEALRRLTQYAIDRHHPPLNEASDPPLALLEAVIDSQAVLVAKWMHVGFIHGVMNTDNMALSGETIDYGPCAFLDYYDPEMAFSSIDAYGRYAFGNQSRIAQWNLARLAEALLMAGSGENEQRHQHAESLIRSFPDRFDKQWLHGMRRKLGLHRPHDTDVELIDDLLAMMRESEVDYTVCFRALCDAAEDNQQPWLALFDDREKPKAWLKQWRDRCQQEEAVGDRASSMRQVNPAVIPRNHRIEQVIQAAVLDGDLSPMERLQEALKRPFEEQEHLTEYMLPPAPAERVRATFCGT